MTARKSQAIILSLKVLKHTNVMHGKPWIHGALAVEVRALIDYGCSTVSKDIAATSYEINDAPQIKILII